jgi:hypothetical protein
MKKLHRHSITTAAALLMSGPRASGAQASPANRKLGPDLASRPAFGSPSILEAWRGGEPWMRDAFKVEKEGGLSFSADTAIERFHHLQRACAEWPERNGAERSVRCRL